MSPLLDVGVFETGVAVVERDPAIESLLELDFCSRKAEAPVLGRDLESTAVPLHDIVVADDAFVAEGTDALEIVGDASAAAGPKGRDASAETDVTAREEILSYSRSRGAFAGVSLEGSTIRPDNGANEKIYGHKVDAKELVLSGTTTPPPSAQQLIATLDNKTPQHRA